MTTKNAKSNLAMKNIEFEALIVDGEGVVRKSEIRVKVWEVKSVCFRRYGH